MSNLDYPNPNEETNATCYTINGREYAWSEDDVVFVYTGVSADNYTHDDGYRPVGILEWPSDDDDMRAITEWIKAHETEITKVITSTNQLIHNRNSDP